MYFKPINRWYVSRWLKGATVEDFMNAVDGINRKLEEATGSKYNLRIAFYKAAEGSAGEDRPQTLVKEVTSLEDVSARLFRKSDYVEATLSVQKEGQMPGDIAAEGRPHFDSAKISAKWPDTRRIDFELNPAEGAIEVCHALHSRFLLWTKGVILS